VDEFTIGPIRTPQELDLARGFLLRFFSSLGAGWRGPGFFHERLAGESAMMLAATREEEIAGVALGHVDGDGLGTVDHQLWVQTPRVDKTLGDRVRGRDGVHAQWVMDKDLNAPYAPAG
jgi:hypothetical protein